MKLNAVIVTNQKNVLANYYETAWSEIFDIMRLDRPYRAHQIAKQMSCFAHLATRTCLDYTKVVLQRLAKNCAADGNYHLIHHRGMWIAPALGSRWYRAAGIS